jgi:hypothetical protein
MTHWKKLTNPNYLGTYALDGEDIVATIKNIGLEIVQNAQGKEECVVCHFLEKDLKPMIMNKTNLKAIEKVAGTPDIEKWPGIRIQVGSEKVAAFGTVTDALRVREFKPTVIEIKCDECHGLVKASNGMSADQVAAYTKAKYGKVLCAECAKKAKEEI